MPKPLVCLSEQLRQFAEYFRPCFSRRQWRYFVIVLLGLVEGEERKTLTGLLRVIGESVSLSGLSRFLNQWRWSTTALAYRWWSYFCERMSEPVRAEHVRLKAAQPHRVGRPKETVVTGFLIFDDSVHTRPKGRVMGGLGRHYSTTEKKVVSGHCLFSGLYVLLEQRYPLEPRMYCQKRVCEAEGVPFQSKYAHLVPSGVRKLRPTLVLMTCHDPEAPLKSVRYWGSTVMELTAQALVDILAVRWEVETCFEYGKDLLGSDHYQVMTRQAILRFWTLTACLFCFLEAQRAAAQEATLTCGDVRRRLQQEHQRNLLQWLAEALQEGRSVDQICSQLTIEPGKVQG